MRLFTLRILIIFISFHAHHLSHKPIASTHSDIQINVLYDAVT